MLWIPIGALGVAVCSLALVALGCALARLNRWGSAALAVAVAALLVRGYAAADPALHPFDERYHALVAKHLIDRPLVPTLYADPVLAYDVKDWHANHVWLHKPPLAMWLQAASMSIFGVSELPLRLPSVLLSSASVLLTFGIGWMLFTPPAALTAAVFHALNGFLVDLASGRRASDHIDALLIFVIEATVLAALLIESRAGTRRARWMPVVIGVGTGLAWLAKSIAALLVIPIWFLIRLPFSPPIVLVRQCVFAAAIAVVVGLPWAIYTWLAFPIEARHESAYALRHVTEVLEGQGGPLWGYLTEMPRFFGESIYVPLLIAMVSVARGTASNARKAMLAWIALPYVLFSLMATKMPAYVMVAAPAMFLLQAEVWIDVFRRFKESLAGRRIALGVALVVLAVLPARHLLNPTGPLEEKDDSQWASDLRDLNTAIGPGKAVVFNVATPIEAMFYTPYVAYDFEPSREQIVALRQRGYRVYRYEARGTHGAPRLSPASAR